MTVLAIAIFLVTLTLVIWQPKGLGIGYSALGGAAIALITTVVQLSDVPTVVDIVWNATLAFVAIVLISLILDESGFFEWAALHVARWGRGRGRLLFVLIVLLGAVIAAIFANDGAALILTPIVIQMLRALNFSAKASLGFILATGFIADAGSLPLVVSNLVNIVSADFFDIDFARYALVMVPVGAVAVLASLGVLFAYFGRSIPKTYDVQALRRPASAICDPLVFRTGWIMLAFLLVGYFAADPLHVPLSVVAGIGAIVLIAVAARQPAFLFSRIRAEERQLVTTTGADAGTVDGTSGADDLPERRRIPVLKVIREAPWQIVLFSVGMYLVVYGLRNQGLTDELAGVFSFFGDRGTLITALGVGTVIAVLASLMNNMPTVLIAALAISATGATGLTHETMVFANVIGSDLGPKITPIGSLATLLWLHVLDRKGIHIGWGQYFRTGIVLTIPVLAITLLALAGWLTILDGY
ncbi:MULTISPECIES: arsenic transporter [unclassified Rathayibacter]|uniref:arsenic transporter n=1 Tax=unclassified Rathayibacter TaxID=2609250 RepID=UPI000CE8B9DC|nr:MULTISPECIES: arsenic transporter [unclassified Rathayibacter]PPI41731.1 arsenical efflux pump membrane protein ArsB [Rathayibacter sp. RFBD1]PPI61914.1 arsenical efflux pump membrane protein ArsB [Rathayibacter sp. TRS19]